MTQPALAQGDRCVEPADIADAAIYTIPLFIEALQTQCTEALPPDSFVRSKGGQFAARFAPLRDDAWPGARRTLVSFIESGTGADRTDAERADPAMGGVVQTLMRMEGDELRPFVDALATQMISDEIKPSACTDIEAILPLLAPLPPENYGELIATIMGFVAKEDADMNICPAS